MVYDPDIFFAPEALQQGDGWSSPTADDQSVIFISFVRLSKTVLTAGSDFANLVKDLVDELKTLRSASEKTEKEVDWLKGLVSEAEKSKTDALNDAISYREMVGATDTHVAGYFLKLRRLHV